jgi:hypothetical protein
MTATTPDPAAIRIARGDPTPEELAVVAALLASVGRSAGLAADGDDAAPVRGRWNDPAHLVRRGWAVGPGGWRAAR